MKPDYIKNEEIKVGVLSEMVFNFRINESIFNFLDEKKIERVYEKIGINEKNEIEINNLVYLTIQHFFFSFNVVRLPYDNDTFCNLTIYYKPNQLNELRIFIRQLFKQFNNETTNN